MPVHLSSTEHPMSRSRGSAHRREREGIFRTASEALEATRPAMRALGVMGVDRSSLAAFPRPFAYAQGQECKQS